MMRLGLEQGLATVEEYEEHLTQLIREFMSSGDAFAERFHNDVAAHLEDLKILCLTRNFRSEQMWAHYAADFKGALLIFRPLSEQSLFTRAEEVRYSDDPYYIFEADEFSKLITGQISMSDREYTSRSVKKIILSKKAGWSYEAEWRINFGSGRAPQEEIEYLPFDGIDLYAICLGLRASPEFIAKVSDLALLHNPKVLLFRSERQTKANRIEYVPIGNLA